MKVGLFFGSFNPIHIGHMMLAEYVLNHTDIERIMFVVSPQNPHKGMAELLDKEERLNMVNIAITNEPRMVYSNIEFDMPIPSYTSDTIIKLKEMHPNDELCIIVGDDAWTNMTIWKNWEYLKTIPTFVYPRPLLNPNAFCIRTVQGDNDTFIKAPLFEVSATFIRNSIKEGKSVSYFLPPKVSDYIKEKGFYK